MRALTVFALASGLSACSGAATVKLRDGSYVEGRIRYSTSETVVLEQSGEERTIARDDVVDVSHPGTEEILVGAGLLGTSALMAVSAAFAVKCGGPSGPCPGALLMFGGAIVVGVPALFVEADGLVTHFSSRARFAPPSADAAWPTRNARGVSLRFAL